MESRTGNPTLATLRPKAERPDPQPGGEAPGRKGERSKMPRPFKKGWLFGGFNPSEKYESQLE